MVMSGVDGVSQEQRDFVSGHCGRGGRGRQGTVWRSFTQGKGKKLFILLGLISLSSCCISRDTDYQSPA